MFKKLSPYILSFGALLGAACGDETWQLDLPGSVVGDLVVSEDFVAVLLDRAGVDFAVVSVQPSTGKIHWIQPELGWESCEQLSGDEQQLFVVCGALITALEPKEGRVLWRVELPARHVGPVQVGQDVLVARLGVPSGVTAQALTVGPGHGQAVEGQSTLELFQPIGEGSQSEAYVWRWMVGYPPAYAWLWMAMEDLEGPRDEVTPDPDEVWAQAQANNRKVQELSLPWELEPYHLDTDYSDELWIAENLTAHALAHHPWHEVETAEEPEAEPTPTPEEDPLVHPYAPGRHMAIVIDRHSGEPLHHLRGSERGQLRLRESLLLWVAPQQVTATDFLSGERQWTWGSGVPDGYEGHVAIVRDEGALVVVTEGGIDVLHPTSGALRWRRKTQGRVEPILAGDKLLILAEGQLVAYDLRFGQPLWKVSAAGVIQSPQVEGDFVCLLSHSGELRIYNVSDGEQRWVVEGPKGQSVQVGLGHFLWRSEDEIKYQRLVNGAQLQSFEVPRALFEKPRGVSSTLRVDFVKKPGGMMLTVDGNRLIFHSL